MKRKIKNGPKRRRWRRRDWSGAHGFGQVRRWGKTVGNFKRERESLRLRIEDRELTDPSRVRERDGEERLGLR